MARDREDTGGAAPDRSPEASGSYLLPPLEHLPWPQGYSRASSRERAVCCGSVRCVRLPGAGVLEPVKVGVLAQRTETQCNPGSQ
jgi:hypothetical protein